MTSGESTEQKKTWSREEFLHEFAGMGGPDIAMRPRHRDRDRERSTKKRWRDESGARRKASEDANSQSTVTIVTRFRGCRDDDPISSIRRYGGQARSSSAESGDNDLGRDDEYDSGGGRVPSLDNGAGVITASLKIPVQSAVGLDDSDIPYIEDGCLSDARKRTVPAAPPRRFRQRSASGSDSSQASGVAYSVTGSLSLIQQGYDSAVGSSAVSSPPVNTTPSSVGSLSPPTSPDATRSSHPDYIPVERLPVTTQKLQIDLGSKGVPTLQKVSITSTCEIQQIGSKPTVPKSASVASVHTALGGGVLRSKTEDFEKIFDSTKRSPEKNVTTVSEKKKYTKRRYTDSRHETKHIPDSETLDRPSGVATSSTSSESARSSTKEKSKMVTVAPTTVYKRRELIASVPKDRHSFM